MAVDIRDRGVRNTSLDPQPAAQRARGLDAGAADPALNSGTPVRVGTGSAVGGGTAAGVPAGTRPVGTVDATERVSSRADDAELRAIFDNAPPLPSSGAHTLGRAERAALGDFLERTHDGDAALMWEALTEMARSSRTDMDLAQRLRNAQQTGKLESKRTAIGTQEDQNRADRSSAGFNLTISIAAAAASYGAYEYGSAVGGQNTGSAFSQAANSLISASGQFINKTAGPQREADRLKVKAMRNEMMQAVFEQGIENAKQNYDEAKEGMKLALKILNEHAERQTQITTTITRI